MSLYQIAKQSKIVVENACDIAEAKLKEFDKYGKSPNGLTPDNVKAMPEWQQAKADFDKAFAELRNFNGWFMKNFKKEIKEERKNKYK